MAHFETKIVSAAVPARPALVEQIQVFVTDVKTAELFKWDAMVSRVNRVVYPIFVFCLWWFFLSFDLLGEYVHPCEEFDIVHGECADGRGILTVLTCTVITIAVMVPAMFASISRRDMRETILTSLGWDGKSKFRFDVPKEDAEG